MIETQNIYHNYPNGVEALKGVSIRISDGEFLAIMGPNGAGKTTLVKHFNGLLKPSKGEVFVDEKNTKKVSVAKLARDVGYVFQNPDHQLFSETVYEEIAFALKNFGMDEETIEKRVEWTLDLLDLKEYVNTSPFMLSGGERKRVALASVLAWDPQIVILDEPTIGQDHGQKEKLRRFLVQLNVQGKTVVIVTHDVEFVVECNPRVVFMADGIIVGDGKAQEVLTDHTVLDKASIVPPQITRVFMGLKDFGFPSDVINVCQAKDAILKFWKCKK